MITNTAQSHPWPTKLVPETQFGYFNLKVAFSSLLPKAVLFENFLTNEECDQLVQLALPRFARSSAVNTETGESEIFESRSSDGMFLGRNENKLVTRVESRIQNCLNWPNVCSEAIQILRYNPGTEYLPHNDYFDPASAGNANILKRGGQRVATLLMYLATPEEGGETVFPDTGLRFQSRKGNALLFAYPVADKTSLSLHGGAVVTKGTKFVATKWFRQREFT